jgi:uncharacterized protein (TIGR02145 family)
METKNRICINPLVLTVVISILFLGCREKDEIVIAPITFNPSITYGSMTDQDGNTYKTVTIVTQTWMAENLRTTKYNNGTTIPLVTSNTEWSKTTPGYCWYKNMETVYRNIYGALYNWHTVITGNLCPAGWHVPSNTEWETLITYVGGEMVAGGKLKETGTIHWYTPNTGATNESGFTALPGGWRESEGIFGYNGIDGLWWSSTEYEDDISCAWDIVVYSTYNDVSSSDWMDKRSGISVRCIKD